jgi:hypothetical protein
MDASNERLLIELVLKQFDENADWPIVDVVHRIALDQGLRLPLGEVFDFFRKHSGVAWQGAQATLRISDLADLPDAKFHRDNFVGALHLMAKKLHATPYSKNAVITSGDVMGELLLDEKASWQLYHLLDISRPYITAGSSIGMDGKSWEYTISPDIILFEQIATFDDYLRKVRELTAANKQRFPAGVQAERDSTAQPLAFLMMPFDEQFDWLHDEIRAAGEDMHVRVERSDDIFKGGVFLDQVEERIARADAVVAVCTGKNANVFYELGISRRHHHAILVAERVDDLPSDVRHFRAQLYGGTGPKDGRGSIRERLAKALQETIAERKRAKAARSSQ